MMSDGVATRMRPSRPDPASISAVAQNGMVSTSHPLATQAGLAVLRKGGSAVDAYVAAAAVQTVVEPTMTSLSGGFYVSVFEPSTGASRTAVGMGRTPAAETGDDFDERAQWSGRTFTTPGWVCGAHSAWKEWGKVGWADLWDGALSCARDGFIVDQLLWGTMWEFRTVPGMYQEGRDVWCPGNRLVCVGELLRQPALARTIEQLAEQGPDYFYQGEFARHFVKTAQAAGGRITMDDMAAAQESASYTRLPTVPVAGGYEVQTNGTMYALALSLASIGKLGERGRPTGDGESLYLLMRIVEEVWNHGLSLQDETPFSESLLEKRAAEVTPEKAEALWPKVQSGPSCPFNGWDLNTNGIVAMDQWGQIAHGAHSTSGPPFGAGFMVDGVSVARPLAYFLRPDAVMPAGWGASLLVTRNGRPVFTAASPSKSAIQNLVQNSVNTLEWKMEPGESVQQPMFGAPNFPSKRPMVEANIGENIITHVEERGLAVQRVSPWEQEMGSCHSIHIDENGVMRGAADPRRLGSVAGY